MTDQAIAQRLETLLSALAEIQRPCRLCQAPLYFVRHRDGQLMPYTADGANHFFHCPSTRRLRTIPPRQESLLDVGPIPD